jgi:hypothetical protein
MTSNPVLRQALALARNNLPIFPCHPGTKIPTTPHGYRDATTDPAQIRDWFTGHPDRNLALPTGAPGYDVLDIDQRGDAGNGFASLSRLREAGLLAAACRTIATPSGGLHYYFAGSRQRTSHLPACHVDFLAQGGYVLFPPSQIGGRSYLLTSFLPGRGGLDWAAAVRILEPAREPPGPAGPAVHGAAAEQRMETLARWLATQREGNRNSALFWAANRALEADPAADLSPLAAAARQTGLDEPEITSTLNSARRVTQVAPRLELPDRQPEGTS